MNFGLAFRCAFWFAFRLPQQRNAWELRIGVDEEVHDVVEQGELNSGMWVSE